MLEREKDVIDGKAGFTTKHFGIFVVIRIHVSMVDKHHEETKYVEVIIIIVVNVGRANLIVPRTMMKWIIM